MEPASSRAVLELDGEDLGRALLADLEPVRSHQAERDAAPADAVPVGTGVYLEAEAGLIVPPMVAADDIEASGGRFVWMPGEPGEKGGGQGSVTWKLHIPREGAYYLWGRVQAPTPDDDSFYVRAFTATAEPLAQTDWPVGTHQTWGWVPFSLTNADTPTPLTLPSGEANLQLRVREDGTRLDRLLLSPSPTPPT